MGTRATDLTVTGVATDHPHAYGDKFFVCVALFLYPGSSPRVWGQETAICGDILENRIIPTRMGTSSKSRAVWNK